MEKMPPESLQQMIRWCDVTLREIRSDIDKSHAVMQFCQDRLALFDEVPEMKEELMDAWVGSVARPKKQ